MLQNRSTNVNKIVDLFFKKRYTFKYIAEAFLLSNKVPDLHKTGGSTRSLPQLSQFWRHKMRLGVAFLILALTAVTGCGIQRNAEPLLIGAASSLSEPLNVLSRDYLASTGISLQISYASSGTLRRQLQEGAPFDLVFFAAEKDIQILIDEGLVFEAGKTNLLTNELLFVSKLPVTLETLHDALMNAGLVAMGDPASVPAGRYAQEVLVTLALDGLPQDHRLLSKDAKQIIQYLNSGNVDAGFIFASDFALLKGNFSALALPSDAHTPIRYPVGVTSTSEQSEAAQAFIDYLSSEDALKVFEKYGFKRYRDTNTR
jgi:molybdate transport system substrate-binding protein